MVGTVETHLVLFSLPWACNRAEVFQQCGDYVPSGEAENTLPPHAAGGRTRSQYSSKENGHTYDSAERRQYFQRSPRMRTPGLCYHRFISITFKPKYCKTSWKSQQHVGWRFLARKSYTGTPRLIVLWFTALHRYRVVVVVVFLTNWRCVATLHQGSPLVPFFPEVFAHTCLCATF